MALKVGEAALTFLAEILPLVPQLLTLLSSVQVAQEKFTTIALRQLTLVTAMILLFIPLLRVVAEVVRHITVLLGKTDQQVEILQLVAEVVVQTFLIQLVLADFVTHLPRRMESAVQVLRPVVQVLVAVVAVPTLLILTA